MAYSGRLQHYVPIKIITSQCMFPCLCQTPLVSEPEDLKLEGEAHLSERDVSLRVSSARVRKSHHSRGLREAFLSAGW